jgi:hypothetical protein
VSFEGEYQVGYAADDHGPAYEDGNANSSNKREHQRKKSGNDKQDAEEDGPVDSFVGEVPDRSGATHRKVLQKM